MEEYIECDGFKFFNNFDSANLAKVEKVEDAYRNIKRNDQSKNSKSENNKIQKLISTNPFPDYEFNIWTKHDCHGTEFQNNNKTWFYFGIKAPKAGLLVKLNLVNLNKQVKMFSQGMTPVSKVIPGQPQWERIKDKPTFIANDQSNEFILSFNYHASENINAVTYFAFTYPFSYTDLQNYLKKIESKMENSKQHAKLADDIYYHRECAVKSLEGRRLDILTISSCHNISTEREARIKDLFPEKNEERPFKFKDKKVIFVSARVHPGETPSSFVLNGLLNLLINRDDQIAIVLRRLYVFKLIPMLNPDGVAQGYYRMDTRGVNLNRLYLNPSKEDHPTIYAAKALLRYYHKSYYSEFNIPEVRSMVDVETNTTNSTDLICDFETDTTSSTDVICNFEPVNISQSISNETNKLLQRVNLMTLEEKNKCIQQGNHLRNCLFQASSENSTLTNEEELEDKLKSAESEEESNRRDVYSSNVAKEKHENSGIFLYIDLHGHASKKGIFMYGNHFDNPDDSSACMLLPKLMSINNPNFHFTSCNFAEKNMYLIDKRDGMSREGSGRVAVHKLFGLVHSYTLECNYNTGRLVNTVPARVKERFRKTHGQLYVPPKYTPSVFEEVGAAFGPSILDMTGHNPNSRLPNSQYRSLKGLISYLKLISNNSFQPSCNKNRSLKNKSQNQEVEYSSEFGDKVLEKWRCLTASSAPDPSDCGCSSELSELSDSSTSAGRQTVYSDEKSADDCGRTENIDKPGGSSNSKDKNKNQKVDGATKKKIKAVSKIRAICNLPKRPQKPSAKKDNDSCSAPTKTTAKKPSDKKAKPMPAVRASRNKAAVVHHVKRTDMKVKLVVSKPLTSLRARAQLRLKLADSQKNKSLAAETLAPVIFYSQKSTKRRKKDSKADKS